MPMEREEFCKTLTSEMERLISDARGKDGLSFLFAVLGIDSGAQDSGWQPMAETHALFQDLVGLIDAPLYDEARARIGLLLYCHITEASYIYHVIYNLLLAVEGQQPKVFNFLDKYRGGVPPSVATKVSEIENKSTELGYPGLAQILEDLIRPDIRNAFFHSDYILHDNEMRLKHRGSQIKKIPLDEVFQLVGKTMDFFNLTTGAIFDARKSFPKGHKIADRKSADGGSLCSIDVMVDDNGVAVGFSCSEPLPMW